jgi:hypothetical protein
MALRQVVDGDNIVTARNQARNRCAADVSGASGDDDSHVASLILIARPPQVPVQDCRIA